MDIKNNVPVNFEFPIKISGLQEISPTLSQGRVRIFYKYENRNGSYITDEFAEKLISTLPYAPVKGIYDGGSQDYLDHGSANAQGRIYGIVPADPHVSWEAHLDEDGIERQYATCDVLVYTALYKEANEIFGKPQSMELYPPSINGEWRVYNGRNYFTFTDGCFFGLQVLGDNVEPCFEGASFFSLKEYNELKGVVELLNKYVHYDGGKSNMADIEEKISSEVETVETEAVEFEAAEVVEEVAEEIEVETEAEAEAEVEAEVATEMTEEKKEESIEESESEFGDCKKKNCALEEEETIDVTEYTSKISALEEEINNYSTKISELEAQVSTLNMEKESVENEFTVSKNRIAELEKQVNDLSSYKYAVEKSQKESVINEYAEFLSNEVIEEFTAKIDEYSAIELDKELAYALKNANISAFTTAPSRIPKEEAMDSISELLSRYKK